MDLATLPLYARAGSIVPLDPVRHYMEQKVAGPTTLRVFPGASGTFTLYDDDGKSMAFKTGKDPRQAWIGMAWNEPSRTLTLSLDPRSKAWKDRRTFAVELAGTRGSKTVVFNGKTTAIRL